MVTAARPDLQPATGKRPPSRLILVSNRGPLEHFLDSAELIRSRGAGGGVAVALNSVAQKEPLTWIAAAGSFADRVVALTGRRVDLGGGSSLRLLNLPEGVQRAFYGSFCNPLLWFVQHSLARDLKDNQPEAALSAWRYGYVRANKLFADAVIDEVRRERAPARVMVHDYHLYLAPRFIRAEAPECVIQHYVHIPWPERHAWFALPSTVVREICLGLLACDSVAFQTDESVENFLATCRSYLGGDAEVRGREGKVHHGGMTTSVWANPISVDVLELRRLAESLEVRRHKARLSEMAAEKTIVRVDRMDPSKNILGGFEAYRMMLRMHPYLQGRVKFLAFLVPSRLGIEEYDTYARRVFALVDAINTEFGTREWQPVKVFYEHNREQALAGLALYDALLVNSVADGMNLVSKEGPMLNEKAGALILSTAAGSYQELRDAALCVEPRDICGTADAMARALQMKPAERERRAASLRALIGRHELNDWLRHQLNDMSLAEYLKAGSRAPGGLAGSAALAR